MFEARQDLEKREGKRLSLEELGRRIAEEEKGRAEPYAPAVVKRWLEGDAEPRDMETWRAIARAFGVRVGWLANDELPMRDDEGTQGAKANSNPPSSVPPAVWRDDPPYSVERLDRPAAKRVPKGKGGKSAMAG